MIAEVERQLKELGAVPVARQGLLEGASSLRRQNRSNIEIDQQRTLPKTGTIEREEYTFEPKMNLIESEHDSSLFLSRFGSLLGHGFRLVTLGSAGFRSQTVNLALIVTVRDSTTLTVESTLIALGDESDVTDLQLFSGAGGYHSSRYDWQGRRLRALEAALQNLGQVLKSQNGTSRKAGLSRPVDGRVSESLVRLDESLPMLVGLDYGLFRGGKRIFYRPRILVRGFFEPSSNRIVPS